MLFFISIFTEVRCVDDYEPRFIMSPIIFIIVEALKFILLLYLL